MKFLVAFVCIALVPIAAEAELAKQCVRVQNDDTIRAYDSLLRTGLLHAYAHLFPQARVPPDDRAVQAGAHIRCMDGRLLACFTGANLPCGKIDAARDNEGADAFCRSNQDAPVAPAFASGHDAAFAYRCVSGRAEITGQTFPLDTRGFAATLWAPLD